MSREQRQLDEINRPMNEELFNNLEKQYQEFAKLKSESEQIMEMRNIMETDCDRPCSGCELENEEHCFTHNCAIRIYNAGYRKQIDGEWIYQEYSMGHYVGKCSICECEADMSNFRPNCGAKMKGGAE